MNKVRKGQKVFVERLDGAYELVTVSSREMHNHYEFYRVAEIPGALFLSRSLLRAAA